MQGRLKKLKSLENEYIYPITVAEGVFTEPNTTLKQKLDQLEGHLHDQSTITPSSSYMIELERWGIAADGTLPRQTTDGINAALAWAAQQGIGHVYLPGGLYTVELDAETLTAIHMPSGIHLQLAPDCVIQLAPNTSPIYQIIHFHQVHHSKLSGGAIRGDKHQHMYEIWLRFERGGINEDGSLNEDPNWIRSQVLNRYEHPGLLSRFRVWKPEGLNTSGYHFYQYKDKITPQHFVGFRDNGVFAPDDPSGRGWFLNENRLEANNKMIITMQIDGNVMSDADIAQLTAKLDNAFYTHETGNGVAIYGSSHIEVSHVDISECTGDGIMTSWANYHEDATLYTQEEMGQFIHIHHCNIHHCRRQGISLAASNDVYVEYNHIHHIGYADDDKTEDGVPPMFGIDIESMVSESNIPYKSEYLGTDGLELNYRIYVMRNYIHHNARGHFVNADGTDVTIAENTFEGYNVGGVSSYQTQFDVKYIHNTLIGCTLMVKGDNYVKGGHFRKGAGLHLQEVNGAVVSECKITDGQLYGSSIYGYFGMPEVDVENNFFSFDVPHGMGNSAKIAFENWEGQVPGGIDVNKLYYVINQTETGFQVSESMGGPPVQLTDRGEPGFHVARVQYGQCYLSDVVVERDWRPDNTYTPYVNLRLAGGVIHNLTVRNYDITIKPPDHYVGRPIVIDGLTQIEGSADLEGCHIKNSSWMRIKSGVLGSDLNFGNAQTNALTRVRVDHSEFRNMGINCHNTTLYGCTIIGGNIQKNDQDTWTAILHSYLEQTKILANWLTLPGGLTVANCLFNQVELQTNENTRLENNTILDG